MEPKFFATPSAFRRWLSRNHTKTKEQWVGFYRKASGKPSITWPESVEVALCFGWIDGLRKGIDDESYAIRFTPRKAGSTWSAINIRTAEKLIQQGLMQPEGLKAFQQRSEGKSAIYSYEQRQNAGLDSAFEKEFRKNKKAWSYFQSRPPWYQRTSAYWVMSAKQEETRWRRLKRLVEDSENERPIGPLKHAKK